MECSSLYSMSRSASSSECSIARSKFCAPAFDSGSLRLPHLGDCTQEGQPLSHPQESIASRVAPNQVRTASNPRWVKPAPPGAASYTKMVGRSVSAWYRVESPPKSQRSQVAISGNKPMAACSAACRVPGISGSVTPAANR